MAKKIFVGNLSFQITDFDLEDLFKEHGEVISAKVIVDRMTGRSRGYGFVEMSTDEAAQKAIDALNGQEVKGRAVNVSFAREQTGEERASRGGGDGYNKRRSYNNY